MNRYLWIALAAWPLLGCDADDTGGVVADAAVRDAFIPEDIRDASTIPMDMGRRDAGETPECLGNEDCAVDESCVDGACVPSDPPPECEGDADCGAGERCVDGACVDGPPPPDCQGDNDCGIGERCVDGACVDGPPPPDCQDDGDCGLGQRCVAGACVDGPPPPDCQDDGDCGLGQRCVAGACVDGPPPECVANDDCGLDEICQDGVCVDAPPPPECQGNADCQNGQICVNGVCRDMPPPACADDGDCPPGQGCMNGICAPVGGPGGCDAPERVVDFGQVRGSTVGAPAVFAGGCGGEDGPEAVFELALPQAGEICLDTGGSAFDTVLYVRAGDCQDAAGEIGCNDDDDFAGGLQSALTVVVRDGAPLFVFVDAFGDGAGDFFLNVTPGACGDEPPPPDCADDGDCALGEACVAGRCVPDAPACVDDADCAAGELCVGGACVPDVPECAADEDCPLGEACVGGVCRLQGDAGTCEAPTPVDADGAAGSTVGAASVHGGSCGGDGAPEAVHRFVAGAGGPVCVSTAGSDFDTVLYVRGDCGDPATELGCNDDGEAAGGLQSSLTLQTEAGATYAIIVDGFVGFADAASGNYVLTITPGACGDEPPPPDCADDAECAAGEICLDGACVPDVPPCVDDLDCALGEICVAGACEPEGGDAGTCDDPAAVPADGANGSTVGALADNAGSCGGGGAPEAVHGFVADADGPICVSTGGSAFDTVLYVRGDCADPDSEIACNDDGAVAGGLQSNVTMQAVAGDAYFIFVDGFGANAGDYTLTVTPGACDDAPPPECAADADCADDEICVAGICEPLVPPCVDDADCDLGEVCVAGVCEPEAAGACADPTPILAFGELVGDTSELAAEHGASCGGRAASPEAIYVFAVNAPGDVCLSTRGSDFDTVLHVRAAACDDPAAEVACNDDSPLAGGTRSAITLAAEADVEYFVFVDGFGANSSGAYTLSVTPGACEAGPPECAEDADCAAGEQCVEGACVAPPACVDDADCAEDERCVEGICEPAAVGACADPTPILAFGPQPGSTVGAPADQGASCGGGARGPEAVYTFGLNQAGVVCLSTAGSAFDTVLHVRTDCEDPASEVACNDDGPNAGGLQSDITLQAAAQTVYYIFVDGFGAASGDFVLDVRPGACDADPPAACQDDADCAEGEQCAAGICQPAPDGTCEAALPILELGAMPGSTAGAPSVHAGSCGGRGPEMVHVFSVNQAAEICLNTAGSAFDTVLYVREAQCGDGAEVACNDDGAVAGGLQSNVTVQAAANTLYYVFVDGFGANSSGDYVLDISVGACGEGPPPPACVDDADCGPGEACVAGACQPAEPPPACVDDADCAAGEACVAGACVAGPAAAGTCEAPTPIGGAGEFRGATAGESLHGASCAAGAASPEAVYEFAGDGAVWCLSTEGSAYDTALHVRAGLCADPAAELACNDDNGGGGLWSRLELATEAGTDYFVFVDGFGRASSGDYLLTVAAGACP